MKAFPMMALGSLALLTAGCGGGGSGGSASTGSFSLGVSDNPANVEAVVIGFRQVVLKSVADENQVFSFEVADTDLKQVDLLNFTGSEVEELVANQQVPVGEYQLCIYMYNGGTANPENKSYVRTNLGADVGLTTPSKGKSCGGVGADEDDTGRLFFNQPFVVAAGNNSFVAEFNLERGLLSPRGTSPLWTIKPTAVQLVNNAEVGTISGQVNAAVIQDCDAQAGSAGATGTIEKVYLYPGTAEVVDNDPSVPNMVDFRGDDPVGADEVAPIAAARVQEVTEGLSTTLQYELAFVTPGTYSLGFTCLAQNDDPNTADSAATPFFLTEDAQGVVVESNTTTVQDLTEG